MMSKLRIPRKIHLVWVGNDNKQPVDCINSWRENHPDWQFKLWSDEDLRENTWINERHLRALIEARLWPGVADLMRYEILFREGGVYVDADSFSVRPLDDWLLESEMFACWESIPLERRAGLVSNAFLGSIPYNPLLGYLIETIRAKDQLLQRWSWRKMRFVPYAPWRSVGPGLLTKCINDYQGEGYHDITILPSHMFCPNHYRGRRHSGKGVVYANHLWANTRRSYEILSEQRQEARSLAPASSSPAHPAALPLQKRAS